MDTARHFNLPPWAIKFFEAVIDDICKHPERKPGVWKFKAGAVLGFSPKELDNFLKQPTTKVLKQWVLHFVSVKYPKRPVADNAVERALQSLGEQVASYKRGANSRNTQSRLRAQYSRQKGYEQQAVATTRRFREVERELQLTKNLLEHRLYQKDAESAVSAMAFNPEKRQCERQFLWAAPATT